LKIHFTTQFKKDYKRVKKQNKDLDKLRAVIEKLVAGQLLESRYKDHQLLGNWKGHRDCHIEPDWILITIYYTSTACGEELHLSNYSR